MKAYRVAKRTTGQRIPMRKIRAVAKRIADEFQPEKIILFGSYAYGTPKPESDVDFLVVMETPLEEWRQRLEISRALSPRPFPMDIIVRSPKVVRERIAVGDFFLKEITARGQVLYDRRRPRVGSES